MGAKQANQNYANCSAKAREYYGENSEMYSAAVSVCNSIYGLDPDSKAVFDTLVLGTLGYSKEEISRIMNAGGVNAAGSSGGAGVKWGWIVAGIALLGLVVIWAVKTGGKK